MATSGADYRNNIRLTIVDAILLTANIFTQKSINRATVRQQQNSAARVIIDIIEEQKEGEPAINNFDDQFAVGLSWESTNHFSVICIDDGSVLFIYKDPSEVP